MSLAFVRPSAPVRRASALRVTGGVGGRHGPVTLSGRSSRSESTSSVTFIDMDAYYRDFRALPLEELN